MCIDISSFCGLLSNYYNSKWVSTLKYCCKSPISSVVIQRIKQNNPQKEAKILAAVLQVLIVIFHVTIALQHNRLLFVQNWMLYFSVRPAEDALHLSVSFQPTVTEAWSPLISLAPWAGLLWDHPPQAPRAAWVWLQLRGADGAYNYSVPTSQVWISNRTWRTFK